MHYASQLNTFWWFMTVHLKKLSVGVTSIDSLRGYQAQRLANVGKLVHVTRNRPRRAEELLDGGSIYWIIKGVMTARQAIIDLVEAQRADGRPACGIVLSPEIISVAPIRMRIFQGWRYLEVTDAPIDIGSDYDENMPSEFVAELRELGIL
tara:strand:- start:114 stop:566 length:453 start_codon:yes stop_codon:yes gene_type:complete